MDVIQNKEQYDAVLKDNGTVFVDFFAEWCGPCKMLAPVVEALAAENPDVKFIKVDIDQNPEIAQQYGIMSIPTLITFKNGALAAQSVGFQPKGALQGLIEQAR